MATGKKVLFAITKSNFGGAQRYVFDLARSVKARGYEVTVAAGVEGGDWLLSACTQEGVRTVTLKHTVRDIGLFKEARAFFELLRLLREEKPDVLHINSSKIGGLGSLAGRCAGVRRIIFTAHGWAFNEKRPFWQKPIIWMAQCVSVLFAHRTIAVSEAIYRDAPLKKGLVLIRHGIAPVAFLSREDAQKRLREVCPNWTSPVIGVIAELHRNKGIDVLLQAVAQLSVHLVIIGDGEERERLRELATMRGVSNRVCFAGHIDNAGTLLKAFDMFVLPSRTEALGYVLLEAGQAGLPVVASHIGGIPEVIENGTTGLLVPKESPTMLAEAVQRLLDDKALQKKLGGALKQKVEREFALDRMVEETIKTYS